MAAYIVGMITGAVCMVVPLCYVMHIDRCVVKVMSEGIVSVDQFLANTQHGLAYGTAVVGAIVLLASTALVAATGLSRLKAARPAAEEDVALPSMDGQ